MSTNDPPISPGVDPVPAPPWPPSLPMAADTRLLAPIWHTALIVIVMLANSAGSAWLASQASKGAVTVSERGRIIQYIATIVLECVLLFLTWIGLRLNRTSLRDVIGGRWDTFEDFLLDVALGLGVWLSAYVLIAGLSYAIGLARTSQIADTKKLAAMIAPQSVVGLLIFIALSLTAGFVEEIIFRGYLQRQISALSRNVYIGLVFSAVIFGAGHGYEGLRRMMLIVILGLIFGAVAMWRKSLRPGMIAHAVFDAAQGVLLFLAYKLGVLAH